MERVSEDIHTAQPTLRTDEKKEGLWNVRG